MYSQYELKQKKDNENQGIGTENSSFPKLSQRLKEVFLT